MRNLLNFNLFESSGFDYNDLFLNKDYKKHLEFSLEGEAKSNNDQDFVKWCVYKAYTNCVLSMDPPSSVVDSFDISKKTPYPSGYETSFDFDREIKMDSSLGVKSVNWFIKNFLEEKVKRIAKTNSITSPEIKTMISSSVHDSIRSVIKDIFLPANIVNIQKLKYLDYLKKYTSEGYYDSLLVDELVVKELDSNFKIASDLYKGIEFSTQLGKRIFDFLKIFAIHNMEYFKNIPLPERMANYVVLYFREADDSFKAADELRKSNVHIYNKIKELLPDIDTSADLGDLGF
jgi:hypothetical protein